MSFSDVTSMITFEKTPYEKEVGETESDSAIGYTLRKRQTETDVQPETTYSLRTRAVCILNVILSLLHWRIRILEMCYQRSHSPSPGTKELSYTGHHRQLSTGGKKIAVYF